MKKRRAISANYLERKPTRRKDIPWQQDEQGIVTLEIENSGFVNYLAQRLLKKPKVSYIHLDEMGSFIWKRLDGEQDLIAIGEKMRSAFGENCAPLYERLAEYIRILDSYHFLEQEKR